MQPLLYLDTNSLVYVFEGNKQYATTIANHIHEHLVAGGSLVTSVITITEFMAGATTADSGNLSLVDGLRILPVDTAIAEQAGSLRKQHGLSTPDALHLATALQSGCGNLLTNDRSFAKLAQRHINVVTL